MPRPAPFDEGKHCYWLALGTKGEAKARRLGLTHNVEFSGEGKRSLTDSAGTQGYASGDKNE